MVQEQNQLMESRIEKLTAAVETLQQQNSHLLQICTALADNSGVLLDKMDDGFTP